jgi:phasin family protein
MPSFPTNPLIRSGLDAQVDFLTELTRRSYDAMRKLSELNLRFAQQVMQDLADTSRNILSCSDPLHMPAAAAKSAQPVSEHLRDYQRQLFSFLSGIQLELTRSAETFAPQASGYATAMADSMAHDSERAGAAFDHAAQGAERAAHSGNGAHYTPQ